MHTCMHAVRMLARMSTRWQARQGASMGTVRVRPGACWQRQGDDVLARKGRLRQEQVQARHARGTQRPRGGSHAQSHAHTHAICTHATAPIAMSASSPRFARPTCAAQGTPRNTMDGFGSFGFGLKGRPSRTPKTVAGLAPPAHALTSSTVLPGFIRRVYGF
jgi:hypothetical protein